MESESDRAACTAAAGVAMDGRDGWSRSTNVDGRTDVERVEGLWNYRGGHGTTALPPAAPYRSIDVMRDVAAALEMCAIPVFSLGNTAVYTDIIVNTVIHQHER